VPATDGAIAVQVGALRSKADAEALARRLSGKGYATYIVAPEAGASQVFKVRVGNYASQDEAERVKRRLQQEEKLKPWITH
jgi:cell division septation protein DedD